MGRHRKPWPWSVGERPYTVTIYEREGRAGLYLRCWDPKARGGRGGYRKRALGHADEERAKLEAKELHLALMKGAETEPEQATLGRIFDAYKRHRTPRKVATEQQNDGRRFKLFEAYFGLDKDPNKISLREWETFIDLRSSGQMDSLGNRVPEKQCRQVRARTVEADLLWLRWVLNWAVKWRVGDGYLLESNPVRGFETPEVKNVRRPVASADRYEAVRAKSDEVTMEIRWRGRRETVRSHLSELLDIAYGTGRRLSAICSLRYEDLRLEEGPHGTVCWPASTDKQGVETLVPISPLVRAALDRTLRDRPGIGKAPIFSSPMDPQTPTSRQFADAWLREAEKLAGVEPQPGSLWHAYRRGWATARKHLPDADVAAAGGWGDTTTLREVYQQADAATMLRVVLEGAELREAR